MSRKPLSQSRIVKNLCQKDDDSQKPVSEKIGYSKSCFNKINIVKILRQKIKIVKNLCRKNQDSQVPASKNYDSHTLLLVRWPIDSA